MKILLTTVSLDAERGGGTAERTRRLAQYLQAAGHECMVASIDGGTLVDHLRHFNIPIYLTGSFRIPLTVPLINPFKLAALIRQADAIHILGYWNLLSVVVAFLAETMCKPYALSAAGEFVGLDNPSIIKSAFHWLFGRRMIDKAQLLVAITALERAQILSRFGGPPERVVVIPNGVELPKPVSHASHGLPESAFILFVGRLAEIKGPDLLLEAFSKICTRYPDVTLVLAGPDFGLGKQLKLRADQYPLSGRVRFIQYLNEIQRTEAYRRADFIVVPSRSEAMSLVALEAGILGTPVLLTDQCGFDQVAEFGGGLVVPATVNGLQTGLEQLLSSPEKLPIMGDRLRSYISRYYTWPTIIADLTEHFRRLLTR